MTTKKKSTKPKSYQVTPDIHQRAIEATVCALIHKGADIGNQGLNMREVRSHFGVSESTAPIVSEVSAQMLVWLARQIDSGAIVPKYEGA